jgi:hypothetical protein
MTAHAPEPEVLIPTALLLVRNADTRDRENINNLNIKRYFHKKIYKLDKYMDELM